MREKPILMLTIVTNTEELIKAQQKYNKQYLANPSGHSEIDDSEETAKNQIDTLLANLPEGHSDEQRSELICNTVAEFMEFLQEKGLEMKDEYFEEFLDA